MIEQGLFKRHFTGRDNFIWWLGQIVDETKWSGNIPGYRTPNLEPHKGFEYRYKVRIMGYHTASPSELSDDDLPWASVMYPVTAGAGTGGSSATPNLRQGNFVYGFFLDGEDAQQPIIMGVLGFNQYTRVLDNVPDVGFIPFQGYRLNKEEVARYSLKLNPDRLPAERENGDSGSVSNVINNSVVGSHGISDGASAENAREGQENHSIPATSVCEKQPLGKIQLDILEMVKDIENARRTLSNWSAKASSKIDDVQRWIERRVERAVEFISQGIEWIVSEIQKRVTKVINDKLKDFYYFIFPNDRPNLKTAVENVNDLIACLFKKIIKNIFKLVENLLLSLFDKLINVPACFAQQFVTVILGGVLNEILSAITSILGTISGIIGTTIDVAGNILGFIADIFSWLTCEEEPKCPEVDSWSPWDGVDKTATFDIQGLIDQVTSFAGSISDQVEDAAGAVTGAVTSIAGTIESAADGFSSSPLGGSCNVGPFRCGPPTVEFFGGEGSGAAGNAIIGFTGELLGVDITSQGSGYSQPPFVKFKDSCGKGKGAVGRAILEFDPDVKASSRGNGNGSNKPSFGGNDGKRGCVPMSGFKNGRVVAVVIEEPGKDYLYTYDGSEGGGGRTFANYCETMVRRANGCYDLPYVSGEQINLNPGDWIKYPDSNPTQITNAQTVTAPKCGEYDSSRPGALPPQIANRTSQAPVDEQAYPIDTVIEEVVILQPGFNYAPGDVVEFIPSDDVPGSPEQYNPPNNGVEAVVTEVDSQGSITGISVLNPGNTFTSYPIISVISDGGFNAKLAPRFSTRRLTDNEYKQRQSDGFEIVKVIDCVGVIPPKLDFLEVG